MALQWDPSLAVGVKVIDTQHQELFRRVNALLDAMIKGQGKPEIEKLFAFLGAYVVDHFGGEERMMAQYKYAGAPAHKSQHTAFVKKYGELKAQFDKGGPTGEISIGINRFVCAWLREHITTTDVAFGKHLKSVGAREAA